MAWLERGNGKWENGQGVDLVGAKWWDYHWLFLFICSVVACYLPNLGYMARRLYA